MDVFILEQEEFICENEYMESCYAFQYYDILSLVQLTEFCNKGNLNIRDGYLYDDAGFRQYRITVKSF